MLQGKSRLPFENTDKQVEKLARYFYNEILIKREMAAMIFLWAEKAAIPLIELFMPRILLERKLRIH